MPLEPGSRLGPYEIVSLRGKGAMGEVYRARDVRLDRDVAIKVLPTAFSRDPTFKRRFEREAKAISQLQHPHVCTLHDVGSEEGVAYLVMEYLEGETLEDCLRRGPLPVSDTLRIGREIAEAVDAAHRRGIVHRDLKPGNIMLTVHGAKVLDFGLAKDVDRVVVALGTQSPTLDGPLTVEGTLAGTMPYMAPEQLEGRPADARTDVWALGCVLYEMATGVRPFRGDTQASLITAIMGSEPEQVSRRQPVAPERLDGIVGRCLEKNPARRWQSTRDLSLELEALAAGVRSAARDPRALPSARGARWYLSAAIVVLVVVVAAGGAWLVSRRSGITRSGIDRDRPAPAAAAVEPLTLAVLPFEVIGPADDTGFTAGLTAEITTRLAANTGLRVTARSSANLYGAGAGKTIQQIGDELGVDYLLQGTVRRAGGRLRVSPELVRVADASTLWAESGGDREMDAANIFEIQSEIAERVCEQLGLSLRAPDAGVESATSSTEAVLAYLRGVELAARPGNRSEDFALAAQAFQRAVDLDPAFALAHLGLADAHGEVYFIERDPDRLAHSKQALHRAIELRPDLPEIERSLGRHFLRTNDYEQARRYLELAARKLPSDGQVLAALAAVHLRSGAVDEYVDTMERATQLDPRSSDLWWQLGLAHTNLSEYEAAEETYRRAITLAPDNRFAHLLRRYNSVFWKGAEAYADPEPEILKGWAIDYWHLHLALWLGRYDDAQRIVDRAPAQGAVSSNAFLPKPLFQGWIHALRGEPELAARSFESARLICNAQLEKQPLDDRAETCLGRVYAGLGRKKDAIEHGRKAVELLLSGQLVGYADPSARQMELARIYAQVGEAELALDALEEVVRGGIGVHLKEWEVDPFFLSLKGHTRYQALLRGGS